NSINAGKPYLASAANETTPAISPDGRWAAVSSDQNGRGEVYVRPYPDPSSRVQISADGGYDPIWSKDGKTIYYRSGDVELAARLEVSPSLRVASRDTAMTAMNTTVRSGVVRGLDM